MNKTKIQTIGALVIFTAFVFVFSCRKAEPEGPPLSLEKDFSVATAKDYFTKNLKKSFAGNLKTTVSLMSEKKTFLGKYNIKWRLAKSFRRGKFEMVEAPMRFERNRLMMYTFGGNEGNEASTEAMAVASFNKFLMYRTEEGRVITRILTFIPDKAYIAKYGMEASKNGSDHLEKNFSGYVEFRTWKQESLFVYRIKDGKVVKKVKLRRKQAASPSGSKKTSRAQTLSGCDVHCDPVYDLVCYEGDFNSESSTGYDAVCELVVVDFECYEDPFCDPYDPGDDPWEDPCNDPGNYYLPECGYEPDPCLDYGICDDPNPSPCGYSYSKNGARIANDCVEIINNIDDPCLNAIAQKLINNDLNGKMSGIINALDGNAKVHIKFLDAPNTSTGAPATTSNISYNATTGDFNATITLGTETLLPSTKENTGAAILHEIVHAYFSYTAQANRLQTKSHEEMADNYIEPMANFLSSLYGMSLRDATALAWAGVSDIQCYVNTPESASVFTYPGGVMTKLEIGDVSRDYITRSSGTAPCN